jgi:hypothetical protein
MITVQRYRFSSNLNEWSGFLNRSTAQANLFNASKGVSELKLVVHLAQKIKRQKALSGQPNQASSSSMRWS